MVLTFLRRRQLCCTVYIVVAIEKAGLGEPPVTLSADKEASGSAASGTPQALPAGTQPPSQATIPSAQPAFMFWEQPREQPREQKNAKSNGRRDVRIIPPDVNPDRVPC